jgi:hypothetical protein
MRRALPEESSLTSTLLPGEFSTSTPLSCGSLSPTLIRARDELWNDRAGPLAVRANRRRTDIDAILLQLMELFWRDVVKRLRPSFLYWLENIKSDPSDDPYDLFARRPLSIKLLALSSNITILSVHSRYLDACQYQRPSFGLSSEISFEHTLNGSSDWSASGFPQPSEGRAESVVTFVHGHGSCEWTTVMTWDGCKLHGDVCGVFQIFFRLEVSA